MLVGTNVIQCTAVALFKRWQQRFIATSFFIILTFLVDRHETGIDDGGTGWHGTGFPRHI